MLDPEKLREAFKRKRYGGGNDYDPDFDLFDVAADELERLRAALEPFTRLGGPNDGVCPAYPDLEDDVVICENSGECVTAGDVRAARNVFGILHAPHRINQQRPPE